MPRSVVIESLPQALRVTKEMNLSGEEDADYRRAGRQTMKDVIEARMRERLSSHLLEMASREVADRRNGSYSRHLLTELGDIELSIPRTRTFSPVETVRAFARRGARVEEGDPGLLRAGALHPQGGRGPFADTWRAPQCSHCEPGGKES